MAKPSLTDQAIEAIDQALLQTDPITRMMLIEHALELHRQALAARVRDPPASAKRRDEASHSRR